MRNMLAGANIALCLGRAGHVVGTQIWNLAFCSVAPEDFNLFYRGGNVNFPLYLYLKDDLGHLFVDHEQFRRKSNLNPKLVEVHRETYGFEPSAEEILYYVYAIVYAQYYREKYAEFLKIDFPRIPFSADAEVFHELAALGERLVGLHLLSSPELDPPIARFEGKGDNRVEKNKSQGFRYDPEEERAYINHTQYFKPVPLEVWEYMVGGYQVCKKWLKDRKERNLELEDIRTYCRIVTALKKTIAIQREIDAVYPAVEERLLEIS